VALPKFYIEKARLNHLSCK